MMVSGLTILILNTQRTSISWKTCEISSTAKKVTDDGNAGHDACRDGDRGAEMCLSMNDRLDVVGYAPEVHKHDRACA